MYHVLRSGKPLPDTKCDTIEQATTLVRTLEHEWESMFPNRKDASPFTIELIRVSYETLPNTTKQTTNPALYSEQE